jgi:hypothetical protein
VMVRLNWLSYDDLYQKVARIFRDFCISCNPLKISSSCIKTTNEDIMTKICSILLVILLASSELLPANNPAPSPDQGELIVKVDPLIELYIVTAYISESFFKKWLTAHNEEYVNDIMQYFSKYKDHSAVKFFEQVWKSDMSTYIPPEIMLYLNSDFTIKQELVVPDDLIANMGGQERLDSFLLNMKSFYQQTAFDNFYSAHQGYYGELCTGVEQLLIQKKAIQKLNDLYGKQLNNYYALVVPLLGYGNGYGPSISSNKEKKDLYCMFSPYQTEEQIIGLIWHEFGHSFVNHVVSDNKELVEQSQHLFGPIESKMGPLYPDWNNSLSEHLVRVNTTELIKDEYGEELALQQVNAHEAQGFLYMQPIAKLMVKYHKKRNKYPDFKSYFPELAKKLVNLDPPKNGNPGGYFSGPLNTISREVTHIIIPTNEKNDSIEARIKEYCGHVKKFFDERNNSDIIIITDLEALKTDLSAGDLLIYGTLEGNLWLKAHTDQFPFQITLEKIVSKEVHEGSNLRFMSAWPHPDNPKQGIAIYTAQRPEDIWGINGIKHGSTDYMIAKGQEVLSTGNYKKKSGSWSF